MNNIRIIHTSKATKDRLTEKESLNLCCKSEGKVIFKLEPTKTFQQIIGFGGAFTEAAAYTLSKMAPEKREEIINK